MSKRATRPSGEQWTPAQETHWLAQTRRALLLGVDVPWKDPDETARFLLNLLREFKFGKKERVASASIRLRRRDLRAEKLAEAAEIVRSSPLASIAAALVRAKKSGEAPIRPSGRDSEFATDVQAFLQELAAVHRDNAFFNVLESFSRFERLPNRRFVAGAVQAWCQIRRVELSAIEIGNPDEPTPLMEFLFVVTTAPGSNRPEKGLSPMSLRRICEEIRRQARGTKVTP